MGTRPGVESDEHDPDTKATIPDAADPPRKLLLVVAVAAVALVLDQVTKAWALGSLIDGPKEIIGSFSLALAYNTGAAFSLGGGKGYGPWIGVLALVVIVVLALGYTSRFTMGAVAAGLIAGGALGNLGDRAFRGDKGFLHGAVIDWIALDWWPTFNIADACISIGAVLLVISSFRLSKA